MELQISIQITIILLIKNFLKILYKLLNVNLKTIFSDFIFLKIDFLSLLSDKSTKKRSQMNGF